MRPLLRHAPIALLVLLAAACSEATGPEDLRRLGTVWFFDEPLVVEVPDTVAAGEPFQISVRTYGGGCHELGDTETGTAGDTLFVLPFDVVQTGEDLVCPDVLLTFDHQVTASWPVPGELTVVVRGWAEPEELERELRRTVVVR